MSVTAQELVARLCRLQEEVVARVYGYGEPNDCFCHEGGFWASGGEATFRSTGQAVEFIERATREALATLPERQPAPLERAILGPIGSPKQTPDSKLIIGWRASDV